MGMEAHHLQSLSRGHNLIVLLIRQHVKYKHPIYRRICVQFSKQCARDGCPDGFQNKYEFRTRAKYGSFDKGLVATRSNKIVAGWIPIATRATARKASAHPFRGRANQYMHFLIMQMLESI